MNSLLKVISIYAVSSVFCMTYAAVVVIANPNVPDGATPKDIKKVFLGKQTQIGNVTVKPVMRDWNLPETEAFTNGVVEQVPAEMQNYWTKKSMSGDGKPPEIKANDAEMKGCIATTPGAIGYIDEKHVDGSVKVIWKP